jgi:hypothetical protein
MAVELGADSQYALALLGSNSDDDQFATPRGGDASSGYGARPYAKNSGVSVPCCLASRLVSSRPAFRMHGSPRAVLTPLFLRFSAMTGRQ